LNLQSKHLIYNLINYLTMTTIKIGTQFTHAETGELMTIIEIVDSQNFWAKSQDLEVFVNINDVVLCEN